MSTIDYWYAGPNGGTLWGGDGVDYMYGADGHDWIFGNGGDDFLWGGGGNDYLYGGTGDDTIFGADGDDTIATGGGGNDAIWGGTGTDTLDLQQTDGGSWSVDLSQGVAMLVVGNPFAFDWFGHGEGQSPTGRIDITQLTSIENVEGSHGNDVIVGSDGDNVLTGGLDGDDFIRGLGGDDSIRALGGRNTIDGGAGDDEILVGLSTDNSITGGTGADTFQFRDNGATEGLIATVEDFSVTDGDTIELDLGGLWDSATATRYAADWWIDHGGGQTWEIHLDYDRDGQGDGRIDVEMEAGYTLLPQYDIDIV